MERVRTQRVKGNKESGSERESGGLHSDGVREVDVMSGESVRAVRKAGLLLYTRKVLQGKWVSSRRCSFGKGAEGRVKAS